MNKQPTNTKHLLTFGHAIGCLIVLLYACKQESASLKDMSYHPMVDGWNTEYDQLNVSPIPIEDKVSLYIFQNESYVWISYDYPEGSYGTLDMTIQSKAIKKPLNLHVSTQLGEWYVGDEENIPKTPTSDLWWNTNGWSANPLWANGIDTVSYDTPEFNIKNGSMREVQLSKKRFGKGSWNIKLNINGIKKGNGEFYNVVFPDNDETYSFEVY